MKALLFVFIFLFSSCTFGSVNLNEGSSYLLSSDHHTPSQLVSYANSFPWIYNKDSSPINAGYSDDVLWVKPPSINVNKIPKDALLVISYPRLDDITVYHYVNGFYFNKYHAGDSHIFSDRYINNRNFLIPLTIKKTSEYDQHQFIIRIKSTSSLVVPIHIYNKTKYFERDTIISFFLVAFYGAMLIMVFYNFAIFIFTMDKIYLRYVFYIFVSTLFLACIDGYTYQFIWGQYPLIQEKSSLLAVPLLSLALISFNRHFLDKVLSDKVVSILNVLQVINSTIFVMMLGITNTLLTEFAMATMMLSGIIMCSLCIIQIFKPNVGMKIFAVAYLFPFISGLVFSLEKFGIIPLTWINMYSIYPAILIEALLLSIALVQRINDVKHMAAQIELELISNKLKAKERENQLLFSIKEKTTEITETKLQAERELQQKNSFLATMSHELRTPMNAVIGMSEALSYTNLDEEQKRCVNIISNSGQILLGVINDILDFSKIEAGQMQLESIDIYLPKLLHECTSMFEVKIRDDLKAYTIISNSVPKNIKGDPIRIKQIITNLMSNAFKFTNSGKIVLSVTYENKMIIISVSDTGIGIKDTSKLFKSFSQVENSTTRKYGGTGLGLVICKKLSNMMGGDITVDTKIGHGTTFSVHIPYVAGSATTAHIYKLACITSNQDFINSIRSINKNSIAFETINQFNKANLPEEYSVVVDEDIDVGDIKNKVIYPATSKKSLVYHYPLSPYEFETILSKSTNNKQSLEDFSGLHVLIAEDNLINQKVIKTLLSKLNVTCDIANDGLEVVNMFNKKPYDIIFMDWEMPNLDGAEATKQIIATGCKIPIVGLSAHALQEIEEYAKTIGMSGFVTKPVTVNKITEALQKYGYK